ncbi:MAG: GntR family transcriptional repressor for pyruvate dehydrogenase complex [Candidatus Azotimanducaceae bacterium]|jgi:GntR family transcriptional repressor for pyruvate dehydrogenase complex
MSTTRHEEIADALTNEILRGRYRLGERLPSERDLAARFDANRGAVREALKKLEQLGLADVQPGGARVRPIEEANLDVVGALMALEDEPDPDLIEQLLDAMGALMRLAAKRAIERASDSEIETTRQLLAKTRVEGISEEDVVQARMELGHHLMELSGNLVLRLIGNSLRVQIMGLDDKPSIVATSHPHEDALHTRLDDALASRNSEAAVVILDEMMQLNTQHVVETLRHMRAAS